MRRTLALNKETLAELTPRELTQVAGAQALTPKCLTFADGCRTPTDHCVSVDYNCLISGHVEPCLTNPCP